MAAFDFPSSPSVNQTYTANGVTWKWNGTMWMRITGAGYLEKIEEGDSKVEVDDSGSGNVTVTTDGTERFRVTSAGLVGIGTDNPNHKLTLFQSGTGTFDAINFVTGNTNSTGYQMGINSSGEVFHWNTTGSSINFATNNTERLRIDSDGRLSAGGASAATNAWSGGDDLVIGSTTSGKRTGITLVSGDDSDGGIYWSDGTGANVYRGQLVYNHASDTMAFYTAASSKLSIDTNGHMRLSSGDLRVGDNTDSNAGTQTISVGSVSSGAGGIGIFANPTNGNSFVQFGDGTSSADQYRGYMNYRHADDSLRFGTAGTDRLHINSTGNIGIGTDNPGEPLHVFVGNGGNGEPIALFEHNHGGGGDASIRIEGGASGNPDEVYLELCDKDDSANSYTMGMNDDVTRLRFEYGARGTNNGKVLLSLDQNGAARFNGASGVLRDPTINNTSYVGLSLWPSGTGGASNYSDNHNISFTQEEGNWLDGHSNSTHSSFGMVFNYTSDGTTMLTRGGMHYDHRGAERLKIWSSYGDISFKTDNGLTGNKTWGTCNKEGLRITNSGHVLRPTMAAAAVTLSAGQTTLSTFNTSYQTLALNSEGYDNANNFNTSNYRFTAPETGFYQVGCNVQLENGSRSASGNRWMYLYPIINGANSPSTSTGGNNADFDPADTYYYNWTYTTLLKLSENDYVEWKYRGNLDSVNLKGGVETIFYFYQVG